MAKGSGGGGRKGSGDTGRGQPSRPRGNPRPATPKRSAKDTTLDAVRAVAQRSGIGRATIADVREMLPKMSREQQDTHLKELQRLGKIVMYRDDTAQMIKFGKERAEQARINAGALHIGPGMERHLVYIS